MDQAIQEAKSCLQRADNTATSLARLLEGRLRHVYSPSTLIRLKKELRKFNMHTGQWNP